MITTQDVHFQLKRDDCCSSEQLCKQTRKQRHILILLISRLLTGCYCLPLANLGTTTKQSLGIGNEAFLSLYNCHQES